MDDIYQTTDQWKERALRKIGQVSGKWTAWVELDKIPQLPARRPIEPVKPTSDDLFAHFKEHLRSQRLAIKRVEDPNAKLEVIPVPSNYDCLVEYNERKAQFDIEWVEYERQVKLANQTYPDENRKVFATLLDCISEGSIQELKRSTEGEQYFNEHDSYNFFKLALTHHAYLPPGISSAAVARAKEDFETLRQKAEDSFTDHYNEFRRRYDVLLKTRGAEAGIPYADFDLRDLLLKSLYPPAWNPWKEYRRATGTMPRTYADVAAALKQTESERILETGIAIDPHMPAAHVTKGSPSSSPLCSPTTSKCQCCGTSFTPKKPSHIRCEKCQEDFTLKRSQERRKPKDMTKKKGKVKPKKSIIKKAHTTSVEDGDEASSDDDASDTEPEGKAHFTSFSCTCSPSVTSNHTTADDLIYFDNCSNLNIIRDRSIAIDIRREPVTTRISGSIPGTLSTNLSADIGDLGRGCYNPNFSRNLISEDSVLKAGYRVVRDSQNDPTYVLYKAGRHPLTFRANSEGTFSTTISAFRTHFQDLYTTANHSDIDRSTLIFTKRQRERASLYHHDHAHSLGHTHHDRVIKAIRMGLLINVPYTEADIRNAQIIYGPCPHCARAKGTKHRQTGQYPDIPTRPGEHLAGDLFMIMGILFSIITCRLIKFRCVTRLQNKGATEITRAIRDTLNVWKGYGGRPKVLSWDQEPALVHSAAEIWAQHSLRLRFVPPDSHERTAERDVRTIKEHVYAAILGLNHAVDEEMVEGLVRDTITLFNFLPNSELPDASPRAVLDGERLNYERWRRVYGGQVAEFEIPYPEQGKKGIKREIGYVIGHQGDNPIVRLLPQGKRLVIRSGHIRPLEKSPAIIALIEQGITGAKRQRYNDLLSEIDEFFAEDYDHPEIPVNVPETTLTMRPPHESEGHDHRDTTQEPQSERAQRQDLVLEGRPNDTTPLQEINDTPANEQQDITTQGLNQTPLPADTQVETVPPPLIRISETIRRSARPAARKPPGFYRKLSSGESVADYTACHMRAAESERLYGKEKTHKAGLTEVSNMIATREAALPQDYRKLSKRAIREALPSFMFYKAKDETPEPVPIEQKPKDGWTTVISKKQRKIMKKLERKIRLRARWVGGGHRQKRSDILAERVAPTARSTTHSILLAIASKEGRKLIVGDIPSAYLQAEHKPADGRPVYIIADKHTSSLIAEAHPEYKDFIMDNGTMILKVQKAMYGLVESAWLWYKELEKHLTSIGYSVSSNDRALFYKHVVKNGVRVASNMASVHVDDIASAATPNPEGKALEEEFWNTMEAKWPGIKRQNGPHYRHLSWNIYQDPKSKVITKSQRDYIVDIIKTSGVEKEHNLPCRSNILETDPDSPKLPEQGISTFRSTLQKVAYTRDGRPDIDFAVSYLQSKQSSPSKQDWDDLAHLLGYLKRFPDKTITYNPSNLQLQGYADASFNITEDARSHYGYIVTLGECLISTKGGRIKTVVRSSTEAEISAVNELVSDLLWCRDILEELGYEQKRIIIHEDNQSCITMLQQEPRNFHSKSRHVRVKWAFFREEYEKRTMKLEYCPTNKMIADLFTKPLGGKAHGLHSNRIFTGREP